jgi:hypothetical protein
LNPTLESASYTHLIIIIAILTAAISRASGNDVTYRPAKSTVAPELRLISFVPDLALSRVFVDINRTSLHYLYFQESK